MSAASKGRIDPDPKRQAEAVLKDSGLKPRDALELFYTQIVKHQVTPFPLQAGSPEGETLRLDARRNELADEF